jgi:hypothetical protein
MLMFNRMILCVSKQQVTAAIWRFGGLAQHQVFEHNETGLKAFQLFLQQHRHVNIDCVVDVIEEDYHLEILPHTRWRNRRDLVARKLSQTYRTTIFRTALYLDRDGTQVRQDDLFLFLALNQTEILKPWLEIIETEQAPLAGVYLISMVSQSLVKALKIKTRHLLLVEKLATGFRQSYLFKGQLRMSRLAPFPGHINDDSLQAFFESEIEKTKRYLLSQRLVNPTDAIQICMPRLVINHQYEIDETAVKDDFNFKYLDIRGVLKKLNLAPVAVANTPELLHMALAARFKRLPSLAPKKLIKSYQVNLLRQYLNIFSISILVIGLMIAAMHLVVNFNQENLFEVLKNKTHQQEVEYQKVAKDFPDTPLPSDDLERAVEIGKTLKSYQKTPVRMMQVLAEALVKVPEIQVNRLKWIQTHDANLQDSETTRTASHQFKNEQTASASLPANELYELVFLGGEIKRFNGDYRAALSMVNQLSEALKNDPNVGVVEIIQAPVNVSSYSSLEGSTTDEIEAKQSAAMFVLKVILKKEPQ